MELLKCELDTEQAAIAGDLGGNLLLLAGPGSGKTRVITHRIAYLHRSGAIPRGSRTLAITFTNKAATEMRDRLALLSCVASRNSTILTFHKLGERLLRAYGYLLGVKQDFVIYDGLMQVAAVQGAAKDLGLQSVNAHDVTHTIDKLKSQHGSGENVRAVLSTGASSTLADIISGYESLLREQNAVDFSDLIWMPARIFQEHPALTRIFQDLFPHVMIDECQDTNQTQLSLISEVFAGSRSVVFAVADEDQSIYAWRGARIQNLKDFLEIFDARLAHLSRNYRCHPSIIRAADALIIQSNNRLKSGGAISCRPDDGRRCVVRVDVPNVITEGSFVAQTIVELKSRGVIMSWGDVSVLSRNWGHLQSSIEALDRARVPRIILNEIDIPHTPEVEAVFAGLRYCANPYDPICKELFAESLAKIDNQNNILELGALKVTESTPMALFAHLLVALDISTTLSSLAEPERAKRTEALRVFRVYCTRVARLAPELSSFYRLLTLEGHVESGFVDAGRDSVNLMSMHTAKGTEKRVVFVLALDDGVFPRFNVPEGSSEWDEERRLFYVSMTRAMDMLFLLHSETRPNSGGFNKPRNPSRLLASIEPALMELVTWRKPNYR